MRVKGSRQRQFALKVFRADEGRWQQLAGGWQDVDLRSAAVAFHPDGKHLALATERGKVLLYPLDKDTPPVQVDELKQGLGVFGYRSGAVCLEFAAQGKELRLTAPDRDQTKRVRTTWKLDLDQGRFERNGTKEEAADPEVAAGKAGKAITVTSPDGTLRVTALASGVVEIRDAKTGEVRQTLNPSKKAASKETK